MKGLGVTKAVKEIGFEGVWVRGYRYMGFGHFPHISQFAMILSLKSFGNS